MPSKRKLVLEPENREANTDNVEVSDESSEGEEETRRAIEGRGSYISSLERRMKVALKHGSLALTCEDSVDIIRDKIFPFLQKNEKIFKLYAPRFKDIDDLCINLETNTTIKWLDISNSNITNKGILALARNRFITELVMLSNKIDDTGASILATTETLKVVNISFNKIGDIGAIELSKNRTFISLNLLCNKIGNDGITALSKNNRLKNLWVSGVKGITDDTVRAFSANDTLNSLCLSGNANINKLLSSLEQKRIQKYNCERKTFMQGCCPQRGAGSPILTAFYKSKIFDPMLIEEISRFLQPQPFKF